MTKPVILVTGGAGYIGSHAVLALLDAGWPVVVLDNLSTGFRWAVPGAATFVEGDVGDAALLRQTIEQHKVAAVIHFAGSLIIPESVTQPLKYYRNNSFNTLSLLEVMKSTGVKHLVFSSTAAVYGVKGAEAITEDALKQPISPYGHSKLMSEQIIRDAAHDGSINYGILRYFNVAGADPAGRSGQSSLGATHLIKVAVEAAVGKRAEVAVFGDDFNTPDGTGVRDYIHVSDLAAAHVLLLEKLMQDSASSHTFNCGYGHGYSVLQVLDTVDQVAGQKVSRRISPRRAGDPDSLIADTTAIRQTLGWQPRYDQLEQIVADALAWERKLADRQN